MSYPPVHYQEYDKNRMIEIIKAYPLATIISIENKEPLITHLPLILKNNNTLIGHIDGANPQAYLMKDNHPITVIFSGPQSYISPSIFKTSQLPTWNFVKVHLKGTVKAISDNMALKNSLITMTTILEAPEHKYALTPENNQMNAALNYINMFEITINNWEGKFKLSQDKNDEERELAKQALMNADNKNLKDLLEKIY